MDKSVILVFAVSMILLVLAQQFLTKPQPKSDSKPEQKQTQSATSTPGTTGVASASPAAAPVIPASQPASAVAATAESDTVVENDLYRITFTNRGSKWQREWGVNMQGESLSLPAEVRLTLSPPSHSLSLQA